jgi:non-specific serine/threonine protein kinase
VATSREPLGIAGETVFRVPSLVVPDPHQLAIEGLNQCEAVQLFIDRARSVQPGFAVTTQNARALVQICIRLDGIPLAIELAASRTRVLSVDQILARLEDRLGLLTGGSRTAPVRHQTLRAAIDWSHHLLSEAERILFRRLSVFAGVWTLEAAEAVCADNGLEQREVLDLLSGLVDKSLVLAEEQDGQQRYHFLATLKQYSQEQLVQKAGAEGMLRRHAEFFLALAEEAEPKLEGPAQRIWLDRLSADYDNIRAALKWALENDADVGLRLAGALGPFWQFRGYWDEGRKGLTAVLKQSDSSSANTPSRGKVLIAVGWMASQQSDDVSARSYAEEALTIYRELGDKRGISRALTVLGHVAQRGSDLTLARSLYEESLAIRWEVGDKREIAVGLNNLGLTEHDRAAARSLHEESLAIRREVGDKRGIAISLDNLGFLARKQGDYTTARSLHEESLTIHRELGNKRGITNSLDLLGILARKQGDYMTARSLHEESLTIHRELGDKRSIAASLHNQGIAAQRQGDYTLARTLYGESLNIAQELGDSAYIAASFESLASLAVSLGQNERAVRLWGAKQALCDMASFTQRPWEFDDSDTGGMDTAREALDKEVFAAAWVQGKTMTRDHSVAYALQKDEGASGLRFGITVNKAQPR